MPPPGPPDSDRADVPDDRRGPRGRRQRSAFRDVDDADQPEASPAPPPSDQPRPTASPLHAARSSRQPASPTEPRRGAGAGSALIPWLISIGAHLAMLPPAVFVAWSVQTLRDESKEVIPLVSLSDTPADALETETLERLEPVAVETPASAPETPAPEATDAELLLDAALPGLGDPLAAAPSFDLSVSDTPQTEVQFMGSGGNARTIVFVLEADGSIISDYPEIVNNLARTLREMTEKQMFSVIVFDGERVKEVPPAGLRTASPAAKAATIAWLRNTTNVKNSGTGDVIPALKLAARLRPELVFLLSQNLYNPGRREYEKERSEILEAVKALPSNMAINTIEFNQVDPLAGNGRTSLMEEIARLSNGGKWNFVQTNVEPLP